MQAEFGPIAGNSRELYTYPPFAEPSLERLVAELKVELGVQDADINVEEVAAANTLYTLNYTDSRLPPEEVIAAWTERKKLVIANPELLWTPGFTLPPYVIPRTGTIRWGVGYQLGDLYDYEFRYDIDFITQRNSWKGYTRFGIRHRKVTFLVKNTDEKVLRLR